MRPILYNDTDGDPYRNNLNAVGSHRYRSTGVVAELNWDLGDKVLTSVTGWDDFERRDVIDEDAGPTVALDNIRSSDVTQFSQEIRIASDETGANHWLAGLYYSTDEMEGSPSFNQSGRLDFNELDTDTAAIFGQADFGVRDDLTLTVGARWTWVDRSFFYQTNSGFAPPELQAGASDSFDDSDWSGRLALDWTPNEDTLVFASISRGFNAGTYNSQFIDEILPTDSESILAYEAGVKRTFASGRGSFEATAFYYDYQDIQVVAVVPRGMIDANVLTNADDATLSGLELQLWSVPTDWLRLNFGASYVDSEYGNLVTRISGTGTTSAPPYDAPIFGTSDVNMKGNPFPNTPELSLNVSAEVTGSAGANWDYYANLDYFWNDEIPRDLQQTKALFTDAHSNLDARVGLASSDGKWDIAVWARNLTDEVYITEAYQVLGFGFFISGANYSYPRTYGLSVGRNF